MAQNNILIKLNNIGWWPSHWVGSLHGSSESAAVGARLMKDRRNRGNTIPSSPISLLIEFSGFQSHPSSGSLLKSPCSRGLSFENPHQNGPPFGRAVGFTRYQESWSVILCKPRWNHLQTKHTGKLQCFHNANNSETIRKICSTASLTQWQEHVTHYLWVLRFSSKVGRKTNSFVQRW